MDLALVVAGLSGRTTRLLLAVTSVLLIIFAASRLDTSALRAGIMAASGTWLVVSIGLHLLIQPIAALQWRALIPGAIHIAWRRLLRLFALTSLMNNAANGFVGHSAGVVLVAAEPGIGSGGALSLLLLDQAAIGVAKIAVVLLAASMAPLPVWMQRGLMGLGAGVALLMALLLFASGASQRWPRLPVLGRFATVPPARFLVAVGCALGVRLAEAGAIATVLTAFGLPVSMTSVLYVLAATSLASMVPVIPANLGAYEGAVVAALRLLGTAPEPALLVAIVLHASQLFASLAPGALLLWLPASHTEQPVLLTPDSPLEPHA